METKKGGTKPPGMDKTNPFEDLERDAKVSIKKKTYFAFGRFFAIQRPQRYNAPFPQEYCAIA